MSYYEWSAPVRATRGYSVPSVPSSSSDGRRSSDTNESHTLIHVRHHFLFRHLLTFHVALASLFWPRIGRTVSYQFDFQSGGRNGRIYNIVCLPIPATYPRLGRTNAT